MMSKAGERLIAAAREARKIVTKRDCNSIHHQLDWVAYYDGMEEDGFYGYGATEAEALQDFKDGPQEWHDELIEAWEAKQKRGKSKDPFGALVCAALLICAAILLAMPDHHCTAFECSLAYQGVEI